MRKFLSMLSVIVLFALQPMQADAKRFGGKSFGNKHYKTAPAKHKRSYKKEDSKKNTAVPAKKSSSMMPGILGGLLVGGLLASLWDGDFDGFEGMQIADMLIMAIVALMLFKLFKSFKMNSGIRRSHLATANYGQNTAYQTNTASSPISASTGQWANDVPMNFPQGFDSISFANGARDHFRQLQAAWNIKDEKTIKEYLAPSLHQEVIDEMNQNSSSQNEVIFVDAEIVRADYDQNTQSISVHFEGECINRVDQSKEKIHDTWHLERNLQQINAPWLIVGINS